MDRRIDLAHLLLARLERLSADSHWAHRASGLRGSLLRCLAQVEEEAGERHMARLERLTRQGFAILEKAASEIS